MDLRVAVRTALVLAVTTKLAGTPYAGTPVVYRPTRKLIAVPSVTLYDTGEKADDVVPLYRRSVHADVWSRLDLDDAEAIASLVNGALDHQPLALPGDEGMVAFLMLQSDQDQTQEDADLVRKMLTYTMLVYEYNGPAPA
jgi:hypothetical protein